MGVERAVTLWYIQRQFILNELAALDGQLAQISALTASSDEQNNKASQEKEALILQQMTRTQAKLRALGPCPKPMMG